MRHRVLNPMTLFFCKNYYICTIETEKIIVMAYNLLKGKKGIIFGALNEKSIAWRVALKAVEEGAEISIVLVKLA